MAGSIYQISKPMSVKEISSKAQDFRFDTAIALKYWLRTAETLLREAHIYERESNDQQAYLLLMRYASLVAEKLPKHPSAKDPENIAGLKAATKTLRGVLDSLEVIKPRIDARYSSWESAVESRKEANLLAGNSRGGSLSHLDVAAASDPAVAGNTTTLGAAENSQLAVKLARRETLRRDAARRATRQAGVSKEEEQERRVAGLWDDWEAGLSRERGAREDAALRENMEATRRRLDGAHDIIRDEGTRRLPKERPLPMNGNTEYRYPSISKSTPLSYQSNFSNEPPRNTSLSQKLPPKPPKERFQEVYDPQPPMRPNKAPPELPEPEISKMKPSPTFTFRPSAYLENGNPLRTVFLPPTLRTEFLRYAESNTRRNLETCGMLCGTLISNALFIQRVVIPEQKNTSDTCEMINESDFFDYCMAEDLMCLGWIHTHPTQTCFMSSRDLHTHNAYQAMMAESIAIVCAPSKSPSWGVFRLTDPPGMSAVSNCRKPGIFHPHDEPNIYTDALRPGHVFEAEGLEFQIMDMRA